MKKIFPLILFISISFTAYASQRSLNDQWLFCLNNQNADLVFVDSKLDWELVNLPHTWNADDAYVTKSYYRGSAWYHKSFSLSETEKFKHLFLKFEGVSSTAYIYLNNKYIGTHKGGYSSFQFDVTPFLNQDTPNELYVKVNNENKDVAPLMGDFTIWGGIYRNVWLVSTDQIYLKSNEYNGQEVLVTTPNVTSETATVKTEMTVVNKSNQTKKIWVRTTIKNKEGSVVAKNSKKITVSKNSEISFTPNQIEIASPELWSPDSPVLYRVDTELLETNGGLIDKKSVNIGFRWYRFDPEKGFFLNGKHLKLIGVNRHQDFEGLGNALTDDFHYKDMQLIKNMGANYIRIAHYPQAEAILDACDQLGIIAWEEVPNIESVLLDSAYTANCITNFKEMLYQHYNHPALIMWGLMNESIWGIIRLFPENERKPYLEKTLELAKVLNKTAHNIDPYRLTTIANHGDRVAYEQAGLNNVTDIVGWNVYNGWYGGDTKGFAETVDEEHRNFPQRILAVSEYGAGSDKRLHSLHPQSFDFSIEYQQKYHEEILPYIKDRDFLCATSVWNMFDFGSANRDESMPRINNKGLVYYNRTPKDVYYYYQAALSSFPVVHIALRDFYNITEVSDSIGKLKYPVKVYSNRNDVELIVNGKSYGVKNPENYTINFLPELINGENVVEVKLNDKIIDALAIQCSIIPQYLSDFSTKFFQIGLNCGSNCNFTDDKSGFTWLADRPYSKGSFGYIGGKEYKPTDYKIGITDQVFGTRNNPLFQTFRLDAEGYQFDVPDGEYQIELSYISTIPEVCGDISEHNSFQFLINQQDVFPSINISKTSNKITSINLQTFFQAKNNAGIFIQLKKINGNSLISAIRITKTGR